MYMCVCIYIYIFCLFVNFYQGDEHLKTRDGNNSRRRRSVAYSISSPRNTWYKTESHFLASYNFLMVQGVLSKNDPMVKYSCSKNTVAIHMDQHISFY